MRNKKVITLVVLALIIGSMFVNSEEHGEAGTFGGSMFTPFWSYLVLKPIVIRYGLVAGPLYLWLDGDGTSFVRNFDRVILYNPPMDGVLPFMNILLRILLPVYSLLIVSIAFYLLFLSSSPKGRENAKSMLSKLVITMVIISLSTQIIEVIFTVSRDLTMSIFSLTGLEIIREILDGGIRGNFVLATWLLVSDVEMGVIPFILVYIFAWMPYMVIAMRNIIITALMILFPLGIILYFIQPLKYIGKTILEQFFIWTFIQAFIALALVSVAKAFSVINLVPNPSISCIHTSIFGPMGVFVGYPVGMVVGPLIGTIADMLIGGAFPLCTTDLKTLGFGIIAHVVIIISPMIMVMLFRKFLP